jgi:hypothetical protein
MKRARWVIGLAGVLLLGAGAWQLWGPRRQPAGQPPLATLEDLAPFREAFNQGAGRVRVVLLLSPT